MPSPDDDRELDRLLATLSAPEPPEGLTQRILDALPGRKSDWTLFIKDLFGTDRPAFPIGGALASLSLGLGLGYWPLATVPAIDPSEAIASETLLADMFGSDLWGDASEAPAQ